MNALVLSGAGNYGALQAGAVLKLLETGFIPELIVGCSAGAMNAIYLATDPSPAGARALGQVWEQISPEVVGKGGMFTGFRRLLARQDSLYPNEPLSRFVRAHLPPEVETFAHLAAQHGVRAYTVAVCLESGLLHVFGDNLQDRLLDGAMASIALPPYFSPWRHAGLRYMDGGVLTKLPLLAATERGATHVVGINVEQAMGTAAAAQDVFGVSSYALSLLADRQAHMEIAWADAAGAAVRVLHLPAPQEVRFWDFSQARRLFEAGYAAAHTELEAEPLQQPPDWQVRLRQGLARAVNPLLAPRYPPDSEREAD